MPTLDDNLSQTSVFGVAADQRNDFTTRTAFEAAWKQHKATCATANIESFRVAYLAGLYHAMNSYSKVVK